jgi:hypothetical protein
MRRPVIPERLHCRQAIPEGNHKWGVELVVGFRWNKSPAGTKTLEGF